MKNNASGVYYNRTAYLDGHIVIQPEHSPTELGFRAMTLADLDAVYQIEQAAYAFPWSKALFEQAICSTKDCWVMEDAHAILGYAIVSYVVGEAELLNVCVAPEQQGRKLGTHLLQHVITQAAAKQNTDMYLEVRASNQAAIRLYERAGFNEVGCRKNYYPTEQGREDALLMALALGY